MKKKAAMISILSNSSLIVMKIVAGIITGSVSVISEAIHSSTDLVASFVAFFGVHEADKPPDHTHQFGHGKYESLSAFVEAILIILAAIYIIYEAVQRIITGAELKETGIALVVMGISMFVNIIVSRYLYKVGREHDSIAITADAKHLSVDVYSAAGVFIGLLLVMLTGFTILDSICAILIAISIFYEGVLLCKGAMNGLVDTSLPDHEIGLIEEVLNGFTGSIKNYHDLRTRKSGSDRYIDLHLTVCPRETIRSAHSTMDSIEKEISSKLANSNVIIHPEPCDHRSEECHVTCVWEENKGKEDD